METILFEHKAEGMLIFLENFFSNVEIQVNDEVVDQDEKKDGDI